MNTHDHVIFAALIHDIGKFWESAGLLEENSQILEQAYRDANTEADPEWDLTSADGLTDETW